MGVGLEDPVERKATFAQKTNQYIGRIGSGVPSPHVASGLMV